MTGKRQLTGTVALRLSVWTAIIVFTGINGALIHPGMRQAAIRIFTPYTKNTILHDAPEILSMSFTNRNENVLGVLQNSPDQIHENELQYGIMNTYRAWQRIAEVYPEYRDGFVQLALLSYQLGDTTLSKQYVERVLSLDPGYTGLNELQVLLGK